MKNKFKKLNNKNQGASDYPLEIESTFTIESLDDEEEEIDFRPGTKLIQQNQQSYNSGLKNIRHYIEKVSESNPRKFGAFFVFIIVAVPLLIVIIVLSNKNNASNNSQGCSSNTLSKWNKYSITSYSGAISTDSSTCSKVGANILAKGGNAVDASIAAALCLGVVSPASSGIGGGCYILVHNRTSGQNEFIDSREYAPSKATPNMFVYDPNQSQDGGLAIAVLGELKGLYLAWERHGSMNVSWKDLVSPAAELAKEWVISDEVAVLIAKAKSQLESGKYKQVAKYFLNSNGKVKKAGDIVRQPELADTLEKIGLQGPSYIYETMADTLSQEIIDAGGIITGDDIRKFNATVYAPIETDVMGHKYIGVGGSSSGGVIVAAILKFMSFIKDPLASQGYIYYHYLAEAFKHMFAIRLSLGDPSFQTSSGPFEALLSDEYISHLVNMTKDDSTLPFREYGGKYNFSFIQAIDHGTSHLSVVDQQGNAVALTSTINTYMGSKVMSPSTGILFNNQMDDFSNPSAPNYFGLAPSPFNYPEPFKKPLSSMSPSFILDKYRNIRLIGGASGGPRIITATAQVILNYLGRGMDILTALTMPRIHTQFIPDLIDVEDQLLVNGDRIEASSLVYRALESRGQKNVTQYDGGMGVSQFISIDPDTGRIEAVSDPRKDGQPAIP